MVIRLALNAVIAIINGGAAIFGTIAAYLVCAHAAFEFLLGIMFVLNPGALHNGWDPDSGMDTYLPDGSGGIAYFYWG